ncbi:MAG: hypothetical protein ACHQ1H_12070 [Nitrososphaerales archaeon]
MFQESQVEAPAEISAAQEENSGIQINYPADLAKELEVKKNFTNEERRAIYEFLLSRGIDGKLKFGSLKEAAKHFQCSSRTVSRVWHRGQQSIVNRSLAADVSARIRGHSGRKQLQIDISQNIKGIPLRNRKNIRSLAFALGLSKSTVHRRVMAGIIKRHTNALKPFLTEENKIARIKFALSMIDPATVLSDSPHFHSQLDHVHLDEKWFYLTEERGRFYLAADEEDPHRTSKSKRFILKVMFMAALSRPRFDPRRNQFWNGKVGIFPLVFQQPAQRSSKNRPAGTMETKSIGSITKDVTKEFLIKHVFPAIRASFLRKPGPGPTEVFIQQDNARAHPNPNDPDLILEGNKNGFIIRLVCQPPNSPDFNVLDLGFFRAIQSLQHQKAPKNIDELIDAVVASFNEMDREKVNHVFLSLQNCFINVLKVHGGNNYKLPHMGKAKLSRQGRLPDNFSCPVDVLQAAKSILDE